MIQINSLQLFQASLAALEQFKGYGYLGRLVQLFIACKYYGNSIPAIGSGLGIDSTTIQRMVDDLFNKPSLAPSSVAMIFSGNLLPPTGVRVPGAAAASNIWRNNFNIQKGYGCFGAPADLNNKQFREQSRKLCPNLLPVVAGQLSGARCALSATGTYRQEDHPKMFRIDPTTRDISVYDVGDRTFYGPRVRSQSGRRVPILPLIVALYYDSPLAAGRQSVDTSDFLMDFNFTNQEFHTYFDDDPTVQEHVSLVAGFPGLSWSSVAGAPAGQPPAVPLPGAAPAAGAAGLVALPPIPVAAPGNPAVVPATATLAAGPSATINPPVGSHWWDAEQAVRLLLESDGWIVTDKTRLRVGYDLHCFKAGSTKLVEVKSSAGSCTPVLTSNEYSTARAERNNYILAIVENYDPNKAVTVQWVQDPATLLFTARQLTAYALPKSQWKPAVRSSIV